MPKEISLNCKGKINLSIDVLDERPDGYHEVEMIMLAVDLFDTVKLCLRPDDRIILHSDADAMPEGMDNLACRAAKLFFDCLQMKNEGKPLDGGYTNGGVDIFIEKRIPMGAGMAGGSADAAGVLCGLNRLYEKPFSRNILMDMGKTLGADIPFCIFGGCALAEGIGERLTALPMPPPMACVVAKPQVAVSTKWVYDQLDLSKRPENLSVKKVVDGIRKGDTKQIIQYAGNILETVTIPAFPVVGEYKRMMWELGADLSLMSGSGSAVFGMFSDRDKAANAYHYFQQYTDEVFLV